MYWTPQIERVLDAVVAAARAGRTTVCDIEGQAGFGKSSLLAHFGDVLGGFHVLRAFGERRTEHDRWQLLDAWTAQGEQPLRAPNALQAWQSLATVSDRLQPTGPVALVVDDLQWIDPESVEALSALVRRADGDRLLVVTAHRRLDGGHRQWEQLIDSSARHVRITLDGLDVTAVTELIAEFRTDPPGGLAEYLRYHAGGNPFHIRALLREYPVDELDARARRGQLPAPDELAAEITRRLSALNRDAVTVLHVLAVLGDQWATLGVLETISGLSDVSGPLRLLHDEELVTLTGHGWQTRGCISHAIIRAAVYGTIVDGERRRLHGAAAARLVDPAERLYHRCAAADGPDPGLARDVAGYAERLYRMEEFRPAARQYGMAAALAGPSPLGERCTLDAEYATLAAGDVVCDGRPTVAADVVSPSPHRRVVIAMRLMRTAQWLRAAEVLDPLTAEVIDSLEPPLRYRALVLRGWSIVAAGRVPQSALPYLDKAAALAGADPTTVDPALRTPFTFAYGQASIAVLVENDEIWGFDALMDTDRAQLATTADGLVRLSWRGSIYAMSGSTAKAVGDLTVVTNRIVQGGMDFRGGTMHALLGLAHFCAGDWRRAAAAFDVARHGDPQRCDPVVAALAPLAAVTGAGQTPALGEALEFSRQARLAAPMRSAVQAGDIADVLALGYAGTVAQRADWLARRSADFGDPRQAPATVAPYLWLLTMGLAAAWAGDAAAVDEWADRLEPLDAGPWRVEAIAWLRALAQRERGRRVSDRLIELAADGLPEIPSVQTLLEADAVAVARSENHAGIAQIYDHAQRTLLDLGADAYTTRLLGDAPMESALPTTRDDPTAALSAREREVAALLAEGLSYAQIAAELYVTRSTVAFHLSNIYAKTATRSRHELSQLLRSR